MLPKRDHELLALRAASNCNSPFEWTEHSAFARAAGLSDDEIARVAQPVDRTAWSERDAALLTAADELTHTHNMTDGTWAVLAGHYDPPALVEILYVVGQYTMLSMVSNAAGLV